MHLCMASSIRAMPEKVKPPARLADIYCPMKYFNNDKLEDKILQLIEKNLVKG